MSSVFCLYSMGNANIDVYAKEGVLVRASFTQKYSKWSDTTIVTWWCQKGDWDVFAKRLSQDTSFCPEIEPDLLVVQCLQDKIGMYMAENGLLKDKD